MNNVMRLVFTLLFIVLVFSAEAQKTYLNNRFLLERISSGNDMLSGTTGMLSSLNSAPPGVVGDAFLRNYFSKTVFLLIDDQKVVSGFASKYDMLRDDFYLLQGNAIRVLPGIKVRNFSYVDSINQAQHHFINGSEFGLESGTPLSGFYEILVDGPLALLKRTEAVVKEADYHAALNVGSKDHRIIKTQSFFVADGKLLKPLPKGKLMPALFAEYAEPIQKFIKVNQLDLRNESHLKAVFEQYYRLKK